MKIARSLAAALVAVSLFSSCKKEESATPEDVAKANEFKVFVESKRFQVTEFYSDKPIDYNEDDEAKQETDLYKYVSAWIKDDYNVFENATGKVMITQNAVKIASIPDEQFTRNFSIGADKNGAYFDFLDYQYNPLKYRLVTFTDDYFLVYVDWHDGAKVFTKFSVKP